MTGYTISKLSKITYVKKYLRSEDSHIILVQSMSIKFNATKAVIYQGALMNMPLAQHLQPLFLTKFCPQPVNHWPFLHNGHITLCCNLIGWYYSGSTFLTGGLLKSDQCCGCLPLRGRASDGWQHQTKKMCLHWANVGRLSLWYPLYRQSGEAWFQTFSW